MHINIGRWIEDELDRIIREAARIADPGERIAFLSEYFLNTPYQESTLIGSDHREEELVIDLGSLDCFTFLDYVEAMRLSSSYSDFKEKLTQVRYRSGLVSFATRNHFFSDWSEYRSAFVRDVTKEISNDKAKNLKKTLNQKADGTLFLSGVATVDRIITYIPADEIDAPMREKLRTGDYLGIYSDSAGLDVSHVGIIIRAETSLFLRHASSSSDIRKVVDQDFMQYIKEKPGLVVLRPLAKKV
ncbi:MAG: DUF1460 domain-containing protein [Nitrospirae bacterium]|nr:DUF1460 domain-containing protein [Nitrospirota bacterium]